MSRRSIWKPAKHIGIMQLSPGRLDPKKEQRKGLEKISKNKTRLSFEMSQCYVPALAGMTPARMEQTSCDDPRADQIAKMKREFISRSRRVLGNSIFSAAALLISFFLLSRLFLSLVSIRCSCHEIYIGRRGISRMYVRTRTLLLCTSTPG